MVDLFDNCVPQSSVVAILMGRALSGGSVGFKLFRQWTLHVFVGFPTMGEMMHDLNVFPMVWQAFLGAWNSPDNPQHFVHGDHLLIATQGIA